MLWSLGILMALGFGAIGVLLVTGIAKLFARSWKAGFVRLALGVTLFVLSVPAMGALGLAYATANHGDQGGDPSIKARFLAEAIAMQMNCGAFGLLVGLGSGVVMALRGRKKRELIV